MLGQITNDNLLVYYPFNGDVLDYSTNGYHGNLIGGSFVEDRNGNLNSALKLNGMSDYVDITAFASVLKDNINEISIYFLLKFETNQPNQVVISLGNNGETIANNVFEIEFENNQFQIETETGNNAINHELDIDQTQNLIDQQWHQILIKLKGDSVTYCRDNNLIFKGEYIPMETTTNELFIGCFDGNSPTESCCFFNGIIDELQIYSSLNLITKDTLNYNSCKSDEYEVVINSNTYNIDNAFGSELVKSDCCVDTVVTIDLIFYDDYNTVLSEEHCSSSNYQLNVNNATYDINNPTGVGIFTAINGCDSIVQIDLIFIDDYNTVLSEEHCSSSNYQLNVNNTTYDINNPTGVEIFTAINGCDSIVQIDLIFIDDYNTVLSEEHCSSSNYQLNVNNTTYDINNPTGVEIFTAINGCDSIVQIDLIFIDDYNTVLSEEHCSSSNYQLNLNNSTYDINNPTGVENFTAINGCDSIVQIDLIFIDDCNIFLPNIISPSSKNLLNRTIYPMSSTDCDLEIINFKIFDRWGNLVHNDPIKPWNGRYNSVKEIKGVYVYVLEFSTACNRSLKAGSVTVI